MPRLSRIKDGLGRMFGKQKDPGNVPASVTQTATISAPPGTNLQVADTSKLNLINHSPEQLMQHVESTLSTVHFGMSNGEKFKEGIGEIWDVIGPMVLLAGTAGEVFAFIWGYSSSPIWWIGASVLATVIVLEATFMVVSYKSSTIRNRAESNPNGSSDIEKKILRRYLIMWVVLAFGVAIGQAAFLISAMGAKMRTSSCSRLLRSPGPFSPWPATTTLLLCTTRARPQVTRQKHSFSRDRLWPEIYLSRKAMK